MRSLLILFVIAAAGFAFILQKKDPTETAAPKAKPTALTQVGAHNWMKHSIDKDRAVAQNVAQQRKDTEVP
jgi:uncharacterized protein YceK